MLLSWMAWLLRLVGQTPPPPSAASPQDKQRKVEVIYQKKTQLEHILLRPDTYIGSVEFVSQPMWVFDKASGKMAFRAANIVPGLYKIFDEILVNAADNKIRDPSMDTIKVAICRETSEISVYNNGRGIPIEIHPVEKVYVPELIFGHLLTSSNYDDGEKKVTGGRNGYGAKLCNIFSTEFTVETADEKSRKRYRQVFSSNMSVRGDPIISKSASSDPEFTRITFKPDLAKFGLSCIDDDHEALFYKRVYDLAGTVKKIKVFINGERINVKTFKQYAEMYLEGSEATAESSSENVDPSLSGPPKILYEAVNDRWEVCVGTSEGQFQQVSFVNSIYTYKGGTHVNYIVDQLTLYLSEFIRKKNKAAQFKPFQIKSHLWVFINCLIENPSFDSQTKENMTLRASAFGSRCDLSEDFLKRVAKTGIVDSVLSWVRSKQDKELKKTDGHKSSRLSGIPKLDDANCAGTRSASKCTLILTEGDSAKALAVSGLSVVGRDYFGVYPLRGKLLNVREASHKQIMDNAEISQMKQILGLQHGKIYTSTDSLRYGHVMIMTDQDHDGSHIKGLVINFLDHFWPSLLRIPGFLTEFITPIVKATRGRQECTFYTIPEYEQWKSENSNGRGFFIKYYKGLGTSTSADAKKYFSSMDTHMKSFSTMLGEERDLVDMAFSKKKADDRKEWLKGFVPGTFIDHSASLIKYSDFINRELILFSMADNIRSIPSVLDGLKPGLRKILFACFKRKLKDEIKVAQLAGYIAEHSAYHHGDQSLCASIVGMAQDFVGSNNINLLYPSGQFGTRIQGGKDAASPRYIFTKLSALARSVFIPEDDPILTYMSDDGQSIEPEWYVPVIPMVLVNGAEGIGTGWSTFIPNYSPLDVISNLLGKLSGEPLQPMHPWYRGFRGTIEELSGDRYRISGHVEKIDSETIRISELPVGTWIQTYKEYLELLLHGTDKTPASIRDFKEYHTDTTVSFVVRLMPAESVPDDESYLLKKFKLSSVISLSNMVAFDRAGKLKRYTSPLEIIEDFYDLRLSFYQKRKEHLAATLRSEWERLESKMRFITEIIEGKLSISKKKRADLGGELSKRGYKSLAAKEQQAREDEGPDDASSGFDYLLSMPLWSLTFERLQKLSRERDAKKEELEVLLSKSPKDLWRADLLDLKRGLDQESSDYRHRIVVPGALEENARPQAQQSQPERSLQEPVSKAVPLSLLDGDLGSAAVEEDSPRQRGRAARAKGSAGQPLAKPSAGKKAASGAKKPLDPLLHAPVPSGSTGAPSSASLAERISAMLSSKPNEAIPNPVECGAPLSPGNSSGKPSTGIEDSGGGPDALPAVLPPRRGKKPSELVSDSSEEDAGTASKKARATRNARTTLKNPTKTPASERDSASDASEEDEDEELYEEDGHDDDDDWM